MQNLVTRVAPPPPQLGRCSAWIALIAMPLVLNAPVFGQCFNGSTLTNPIIVKVSHSTRGDGNLGEDFKGPTYPSLFSYKAVCEHVTESELYAGLRLFDADGQPTDFGLSCCTDREIDITFEQTPRTKAFQQWTVTGSNLKDLQLKYFCCNPPAGVALLTDVPQVSSTQWKLRAQKNFLPAAGTPLCGCPPSGYSKTCYGYLALDMTFNNALKPDWEAPEEFGLKYVSAVDTLPGANQKFFKIGAQDIGPVWVIQDSCECRSLFTYPSPLPVPDNESVNPGPPCIQLSPGFKQVAGHPTVSGCAALYYDPNPAPLGADLGNYYLQNRPCAASEVVIEGAFMQILLGYIDQNAATAGRVYGSFYEYLDSYDDVAVVIRVKNQNNWQTPADCTAGPSSYAYATAGNSGTAGRDFVLEERVPVGFNVNCVQGGDFKWQELVPAFDGLNWNYTVSFKGDQGTLSTAFYRKLRGLRIRALGDTNIEGPEIAHLELVSATLNHNATESPVNLGWSKAFRAVILDQEHWNPVGQ